MRIQVAGGSGWLVIARQYYPGWKASTEGPGGGWRSERSERPATVFPGNAVYRVIGLSGDNAHAIVLSYEPQSWTHAIFISSAGGMMLLLLVGYGLGQKA